MNFKLHGQKSLTLNPAWTTRTVLLFTFISILSVIAYLDQLPSWVQRIPHFDWLMHFLLLGALGFGLHKTLYEKNFRIQQWVLPIGPCIVSVWSILDESIQLFSPNRVFSPADMTANLLGIWLVFIVNFQLQKRKAVR